MQLFGGRRSFLSSSARKQPLAFCLSSSATSLCPRLLRSICPVPTFLGTNGVRQLPGQHRCRSTDCLVLASYPGKLPVVDTETAGRMLQRVEKFLQTFCGPKPPLIHLYADGNLPEWVSDCQIGIVQLTLKFKFDISATVEILTGAADLQISGAFSIPHKNSPSHPSVFLLAPHFIPEREEALARR